MNECNYNYASGLRRFTTVVGYIRTATGACRLMVIEAFITALTDERRIDLLTAGVVWTRSLVVATVVFVCTQYTLRFHGINLWVMRERRSLNFKNEIQ